jgi:hypothetical protein
MEMLELGRRVYAGEPCLVEARFVDRDQQFAWFNFVLVGLNGDVIAKVTKYRVILLNDAT